LIIAIKGSYNFVVVLLKRFYVNKFLSQSLWHFKKIKLELIWSNFFHVILINKRVNPLLSKNLDTCEFEA